MVDSIYQISGPISSLKRNQRLYVILTYYIYLNFFCENLKKKCFFSDFSFSTCNVAVLWIPTPWQKSTPMIQNTKCMQAIWMKITMNEMNLGLCRIYRKTSRIHSILINIILLTADVVFLFSRIFFEKYGVNKLLLTNIEWILAKYSCFII